MIVLYSLFWLFTKVSFGIDMAKWQLFEDNIRDIDEPVVFGGSGWIDTVFTETSKTFFVSSWNAIWVDIRVILCSRLYQFYTAQWLTFEGFHKVQISVQNGHVKFLTKEKLHNHNSNRFLLKSKRIGHWIFVRYSAKVETNYSFESLSPLTSSFSSMTFKSTVLWSKMLLASEMIRWHSNLSWVCWS